MGRLDVVTVTNRVARAREAQALALAAAREVMLELLGAARRLEAVAGEVADLESIHPGVQQMAEKMRNETKGRADALEAVMGRIA